MYKGNHQFPIYVHHVEILKTASPVLSDYVARAKVKVVGGVYKLKDGRVEWLS